MWSCWQLHPSSPLSKAALWGQALRAGSSQVPPWLTRFWDLVRCSIGMLAPSELAQGSLTKYLLFTARRFLIIYWALPKEKNDLPDSDICRLRISKPFFVTLSVNGKESFLSSCLLLEDRGELEGKFYSVPFRWSALLHVQAGTRAGSKEMAEKESKTSLWAVCM